jgi:hypothetical protein
MIPIAYGITTGESVEGTYRPFLIWIVVFTVLASKGRRSTTGVIV